MSSARADLPAGCAELGFALTDHSCFHAKFGPYTTVTAASGLPSAATAPQIDDVHTYYDVVLPSPTGQNTVSYKVASAARVGTWAIFHDARVPIRVVAESGQEQSVVLSHDVTSCELLPRVDVFELGFERYRVVLGPTNVTRSVLVIENISDFMRVNGRDLDGDGYGDSADAVVTACVPAAGYVQDASDCNDDNPAIHPGAPEVCDDSDQNCNGIVDDIGLPCTSGLGRCRTSGMMRCVASQSPAECSAVASAPGVETCDGIDEDCDGTPDLHENGLCTMSDAPACVLVLGTTRCGCNADADCGGSSSERVCDLDQRRCVTGCVALPGRNSCPAGLVCTSADPAAPGTCVSPTSGCTDDAACAHSPEKPRCLAPPGQLGRCVECIDAASCDQRSDRRTACIGMDHTCAECSAEDSSRCESTKYGVACLPSGRCGCSDDSACAGGRTCDVARGECSSAADAGAGDASAGDDPIPPESSCGCRVVGTRGSSTQALIVFALASVIATRRRLRRGIAVGGCAALTAFAGCGGRLDAVPSHETATPPSSGLGVDGGDAMFVDATTAVDAPTDAGSLDACVLKLGSKVIGHACSHMTNGPFETVVAGAGIDALPEVNLVHRVYDVVMPSVSPPWSGAVTSAPPRDGRHAFFTSPRVDVRVFTGATELVAVHREDISEDECASIRDAAVLPLVKDQLVRVELSNATAREVTLFIEHIGTFADEAWDSACSP